MRNVTDKEILDWLESFISKPLGYPPRQVLHVTFAAGRNLRFDLREAVKQQILGAEINKEK